MDKKTKKRVETLRSKLQGLQKRMAGQKSQPDDPDELARLEQEMKDTQTQLIKLVEK